MGFRILSATGVRSGRPIRGLLRRLPLPRGLFGKSAKRQCDVVRRPSLKTRAREEQLDWSERSREVFENAMDKATQYSKTALNAWDNAEEKPAVVAISVLALVMLYAANATLGAMENVPLVGGSLKVVGLYVTGWFIYRMMAFEVDREEAVSSFKDLTKKITGK